MLIFKLKALVQSHLKLLARWADLFLPALLFVTTICVFVPFSPTMPVDGLDASWQFAMNQALGQGLVVGKEISFTFGPYASIYTTNYHPATDFLMLWGSFYLGIMSALLLITLFKNRGYLLNFGVILVLGSFIFLRDSLLFLYPLMLGVYCYQLVIGKKVDVISLSGILKLAFFLFPLGLIPLIKGSFLILCLALLLLIFILFLLYHAWQFVLVCLAVPMIAVAFFWLTAQQSIVDLPSYFSGLGSVIGGYTEAMMSSGRLVEILLYVIASLWWLWLIFSEIKQEYKAKVFLILTFGFSLFVVFKAGFVRHDGHAIMAGTFLIFVALLLFSILHSKAAKQALLFSLFISIFINYHYLQFTPKTIGLNFVKTFSDAWHGAKLRVQSPKLLNQQYKEAITNINAKLHLPRLEGTSDIYSYNQSSLIASGNVWNPRPTFQSYSVYTPSLMMTNKAHLLGALGPDHIFFKIEPIDGRLPALDDAASWPVLLTNYKPKSLENDYLLLNKISNTEKNLAPLLNLKSHMLGDEVFVPETVMPVFAKIEIKQRLIGKVMNTIFKTSPLKITLNFADGMKKQFRFVSGMAKTGVVISPLIENTTDFALLYGDITLLNSKKVKSFKIEAGRFESYWQPSYTVVLETFTVQQNKNLMFLYEFQKINKGFGDLPVHEQKKCDGSVDFLNGSLPLVTSFSVDNILNVSGWFAESTEHGLVPEKVMLVLSNKKGERYWTNTLKTLRPDVGIHFKNSALNNSGYSANADVSSLSGDFYLDLAYLKDGGVNICSQFHIPIHLKDR